MKASTEAHSGSHDVDVLKRLMAARSTCRAYRPDPIPQQVIHGIVDIARRTPSWCNTQPWHVVVTSSDSTEAFRQALVQQATHVTGTDSDIPFPEEYRDIYAERRREAGFRMYEALGSSAACQDR